MKRETYIVIGMLIMFVALLFVDMALTHRVTKLSQENKDLQDALQMQCDYVKQIEAHEAPYGE